MKIAIISDAHNNLATLKKVLDYCERENIETIICCGDLASLETLDFLNDNFSGREIYFAFGNMDDGHLKNAAIGDTYRKTRVFRNFGEALIGGNHAKSESGSDHGPKKIAFVHYPEKARELCASGKYDFVFHGHTHKPWTEKTGNCILLNPGNVAGEIYPPTFAVWNIGNDKFELVRIHGL